MNREEGEREAGQKLMKNKINVKTKCGLLLLMLINEKDKQK